MKINHNEKDALLILECYNSTFIGVILTLCGGAKYKCQSNTDLGVDLAP